jgi:TorA maturation chaperone TorD
LGFGAPSEESIARLTANDNAAALIAAAMLLDPQQKFRLASSIAALSQAGKDGSESLSSAYQALFGHTARGEIPPYETEYGQEALFQQPQELSDLMGFYRAFGLALKDGQYERPDHVSCECEFSSFLALKEAYALEHNDPDMLAETRKAQKLFLRDHLGRFIPAFATSLEKHDRGGFYARLGELSLALVTLESLRHDVPLGARNIGLRPADDDRVPIACAAGSQCTAMPGAHLSEESDFCD